MITRQEYLQNSNELHHKYFGQFATRAMGQSIADYFGHDRMMGWTDPHLNDVPCQSRGGKCWDNISCIVGMSTINAVRESGDKAPNTLSVRVCILKAAARKYIEEHRNGARA